MQYGQMLSAVPTYKNRRCTACGTVNLVPGGGVIKAKSQWEVETAFETASKATEMAAGPVRVVKRVEKTSE
jgi:hypothetical protein